MRHDLSAAATALVQELRDAGHTGAEAMAICAAVAGYLTGLLPPEEHEQQRRFLAWVWERNRRKAAGELTGLAAMPAEGRA